MNSQGSFRETADRQGDDAPTLFAAEEFGEELVADSTAGEGVFAALLLSREGIAPSQPLRLRRIRVKNVLGFSDTTVYPDEFAVLVGVNSSGKSSLMRLVTFAQTLMRVHVERQDDGHVILANGRNLDDSLLPVPEVRDLWYKGIRRSGNDWVMAEIELEFETGLVVAFGLKGPFGHATSRLFDSATRRISHDDFARLTGYPIVYVPSSVGVVDREEYRTPARILSLIAGGRAHEVLRNLLLDLAHEDRLAPSYERYRLAGEQLDLGAGSLRLIETQPERRLECVLRLGRAVDRQPSLRTASGMRPD
jgi:hypothetical protein